MATTTATRRGGKTYKSTKPRRDVTQTNLPVDGEGKLDLVKVLLAALTVPGRMSNAFNRFHRYSFLNMLLVFMQTGRLEPVANFKKWQSLGRKIISGKGSGLFIRHPKPVYKRDQAGNTVYGEDGKPVIAFTMFELRPTVFQLSQTDGPELEFPPTPDWDLELALESLDIQRVPFRKADGNIEGYAYERKLALNPVTVSPFETAIHEIAHIVLGHTSKDRSGDYAKHRGVMEFQAEAVALLVNRELDVDGYDEAASRAYIQSWLGGTASDYVDGNKLVDNDVVREIFSATDKILVAGRKRHYDKLAESELAS
jgi:hypothetical protein